MQCARNGKSTLTSLLDNYINGYNKEDNNVYNKMPHQTEILATSKFPLQPGNNLRNGALLMLTETCDVSMLLDH